MPAIADLVEVDCSPSGTQVSLARVAVRRDGLHVRVRNTSRKSGVYLNYQFGPTSGGGGDPVDRDTLMVLNPPPGQVRFHCSYDNGADEDPAQAVDVLDPSHAWQTGTLARLGCDRPEWSTIDWTYRAGTGASADTALADLSKQMDHPVTWRHVPEGYPDAMTQTYVLMRAGTPWGTASVTQEGTDVYSASMGGLCDRPPGLRAVPGTP